MSALSEGHLAWGLTKEKHAELDAELSDHLYCLQGAEGSAAVAAARGRINSPEGRRKLTAPHLAEQLAGTLHRWPTKQEWRELIVLLAWFALIFVSDAVSLWAAKQLNVNGHYWEPGFHFTPAYAWGTTVAWILQAVARAGFFASFTASLWRAWKLGRGVCLARVLQLKLIHTVLVVTTLFLLGPLLWEAWFSPIALETAGPAFLTAPWIFGAVLLLAVAVLALSRRRMWQTALALVFCAGFLYPAAPVRMNTVYYERPLATSWVTDDQGTRHSVPSTDRAKIERKAQAVADSSSTAAVDVATNTWTQKFSEPSPCFFHVLTWQSNLYQWHYAEVRRVPGGITLPLSAPGGGLGWLALPIPILGLIGLIAMALVMGRRGRAEAALYAMLCFIAIVSTILPFAYCAGSNAQDIIDLSPTAVLSSPLPGFESLLIGSNMADSGLLIFGLVLSAGVPWLVTGLFLRPRKSTLPTRGVEAE